MITTHISRNYLITAIFHIKSILQIDEYKITIMEYNLFRSYLLEKIQQNNIDATIIDDYLDEQYVYYDNSESCIRLKNAEYLGLKKAKARYQGYLPFEILEFLYSDEVLDIVYKIILEDKERRVTTLNEEITSLKSKYTNYKLLQRIKKTD